MKNESEFISILFEIENMRNDEFNMFCLALLHQTPQKSKEDAIHKFLTIVKRFRNERTQIKPPLE